MTATSGVHQPTALRMQSPHSGSVSSCLHSRSAMAARVLVPMYQSRMRHQRAFMGASVGGRGES